MIWCFERYGRKEGSKRDRGMEEKMSVSEFQWDSGIVVLYLYCVFTVLLFMCRPVANLSKAGVKEKGGESVEVRDGLWIISFENLPCQSGRGRGLSAPSNGHFRAHRHSALTFDRWVC
jgi:hypothetical protein